MENKKQTSLVGLIGGIALILLALYNLVNFVRHFYFPALLSMVGLIILAVAVFMNNRTILPVIGAGILSLGYLIYGLIGITHGPWLLFNLLSIVALIIETLIIFAQFTNFLPKLKDITKKLFFIPAAILAAVALLAFVIDLINIPELFFRCFVAFFWNILLAAAMGLIALWVVNPDFLKQAQKVSASGTASSAPSATASPATTTGTAAPSQADGSFNMAAHVILLLLSGGLWSLIWTYRVTDFLNCVEGEEPRNPVTKLLLCMFVPFYYVYWTYISAQRIDKLAAQRGLSSDLATICLVLAIFIPIVPPIMMQDKINSICGAAKN